MGSVIAYEAISIGRVPQTLGTVILNPCLSDLVRFENLPLSGPACIIQSELLEVNPSVVKSPQVVPVPMWLVMTPWWN